VDIVLHPSWWFENEGITFDEDFFYDPKKRVESEQHMEQALFERWGKYGLGSERDQSTPLIGAVHLAAGFLVSEMLGCKVEYRENAAPQVLCAHKQSLDIDIRQAFNSRVFKRFEELREALKREFGYIKGDVNWAGILNIALDLRGELIFTDMFDRPDEVNKFFSQIGSLLEKFVQGIQRETGSSSISVNRNVRHIAKPVFLSSECSHTMISTDHYENYLLDFDKKWSNKYRPYGIHYCGEDVHRHVASLVKIPHLDFLDVGWGGDIKKLRTNLPTTFLNIRLSPVKLIHDSCEEIEAAIRKLVNDSGNPSLTGICCINIDHHVKDEKISTIFKTARQLRKERQ
jgi:uroporphyrinogen-III decarboxylase